MRNVQFLKSIPFSTCKSNFLTLLENPDHLPQRKELAEFIESHNIVDMSITNTTQQHQAVGLIINHQYCSLDVLKNKIVESSEFARQYFYLAINKFYVYSTVDNLVEHSRDHDDIHLVEYCYKIIERQFAMLNYTTRNDDRGSLGNFLHPVTTMFFKRHE